ncbi:3-deoxy-D-manno-octulosonic acid kinase [Thalassobius sp. I31.1]|uniref:3-deoxy-D-manno-octulosonic acid kinase n=1 Tax=Thalassobius sp. I31.1 TaxID=2109912 RepID=UPI000D1ACDE6|nr:3-deoxy-D-manno-octulosonic acid kinase [Thalassobius sp. I31.1]
METERMPSTGQGFKTLQDRKQVLWYDPVLISTFEINLFSPEWLQAEGKLRATSQGRNAAWFIHHDGVDMVLRHYYRGGLIGRVNKDLFLRQPVGKSRAMAEFSLLSWMYEQDLPVPRPVAARFSPVGIFYRADILTQTIPASETLADRLLHAPLDENTWHSVGEAVAKIHGAGVLHSDLNCRNILIDQSSKIWIIDFDKCERRGNGDWRDDNLARLHRSFVKEKTKQASLHWEEADWECFMTGYHKYQKQ